MMEQSEALREQASELGNIHDDEPSLRKLRRGGGAWRRRGGGL